MTRPTHGALRAPTSRCGARFTEFGGWDMPVRYGSIIDEHHAVRRRGRPVRPLAHGRAAASAAPVPRRAWPRALVNDPGAAGRSGGPATRCCARPTAASSTTSSSIASPTTAFLVVPNASNREVVADELERAPHWATTPPSWTRRSRPRCWPSRARPRRGILARLTELDLAALRNYGAAEATVAGVPALLARTGYTGEDGFELFVAWDDGPALWAALLEAGRDDGLVPCGLGARDTLRLEAGHAALRQRARPRDHRPSRPASAGPSSSTTSFVGRDALEAAPTGPRKQLVGLVAARPRHRPPRLPRRPAPASRSRSAWSPAAASRPRSARPSPWPTFRPPTRPRVPCSRSSSAGLPCPPRSCRCRSIDDRADEPAPRPAGGASAGRR